MDNCKNCLCPNCANNCQQCALCEYADYGGGQKVIDEMKNRYRSYKMLECKSYCLCKRIK